MQSNKRIVITGVSRGLGRAMTAGFIAAGHTVVGCARSEAAIEELRGQFSAPHRFDVLDVSDDAAVAAWAKQILSGGPAPDLLINNAAVVNANGPLWEVPADDFSRVIDVNIKGVTNVIRHFAPAMIARGTGVMVNLSSGWGRSVSADVATYCATKWAIEGLTQALAEDLPAGLAAVPLNPGVINTEMLQSCFGPAAASYCDPDEWAERAVPFLLDLDATDNGRPLTVPS